MGREESTARRLESFRYYLCVTYLKMSTGPFYHKCPFTHFDVVLYAL
jgi:hypothetical protein